MTSSVKRSVCVVAGLALAVVFAAAGEAGAQEKGKSIRTEGEWVKYDAAASTVTAKVKKPGRGKDAKLLKANKEAEFLVKAEGSVLTRTTVSINGKKGELTDIPAGKSVNIYWRPDETDPTKPRARKIDVFLSDEELDEMYGVE